MDLLKLSDDELKHLKLMFNSNWRYEHKGRPDYIQNIFGKKDKYFDLLDMYSSGKADLVLESVKLHDPRPYRRRFKKDDLVFAFISFDEKEWLLVNAYRVTDDSKKMVDVDESALANYQKYFGRLIIVWDNRKTRNIRMTNKKTISELSVKTILEKPYYETAIKFPGYRSVNISFEQLQYYITLDTWKTALKNQQGIYLITDTKTNKRYVGSATGKSGILGRWQNYANNYNGGDVELKSLKDAYIMENFRYTILEVFDDSVDAETIKKRERWWKQTMLSYKVKYPKFGYNDNIEGE